MKKLVFLTVCSVAFAISCFAQNNIKGEKGISSVGVIVGHAVNSKALTVGVDYRYNIMDRIRLAPSVLYIMKNDLVSSLYANADVHYLARITKEVTIYPIGGLGVSMRSSDIFELKAPSEFDPENPLDIYKTKSDTKTNVGLNLGFGGEMRLTKDLIIGAEFKYNLTKERIYDQAMLLARLAYYF